MRILRTTQLGASASRDADTVAALRPLKRISRHAVVSYLEECRPV